MNVLQEERRGERAKLAVATASDRLRAALEVLEQKYNFNPNQPRRPKGTPIGGQWMGVPLDMQFGPSPEDLNRSMMEASDRSERFVREHPTEITRALGALQTIIGGLEMVGGVALVTGGGATSEIGVGIPVALAGAWVVTSGYQNAEAGWHALLTGEPQETSLRKALRSMGLSDVQADSVELVLSGASGATALKAGSKAIDRAARRALLRQSLRPFDPSEALSVTSDGRSLWAQTIIRKRGDAWEEFDARRTGFIRTERAKAFDQISPNGRTAISNKTLDSQRETYLRRDRRQLYNTLKKYIGQAAVHAPNHPWSGLPLAPSERRIHLLLRFADSVPAQALQIAAAERYAKEMGVILQIEYAF